ncbi:PREDICTED: endogenous retrovirus group K member 19 Gag polyprotein-like [Hipposideros armiger]|uniref:Endogenous retrovirus group K member 19 Gag polyprotein-like n=1 Tax=Hipposideros armiger TaxID=186990 RepID=A0A8B7Q9V5_HIPAR|nr:PREDICTED: endogenous retrovirus group K member 19 Gag polyprotein-like [Hipposideros armiger]
MGQSGSRDHQLYLQLLRSMLQACGRPVKRHQLEDFLAYIQDTCPWFPKEGTLDSKIWEKVGIQLQERQALDGPGKFSGDILSLWELVRDSLDPSPEASCPLKTQSQPIVERFSNDVREFEETRSQEKHTLAKKNKDKIPSQRTLLRRKKRTRSLRRRARPSSLGPRIIPGEGVPPHGTYCHLRSQQQPVLQQLVKYVSGSKNRIPETSVLCGLRQAAERDKDIGEYQQFCFPVIECLDPNNPGQVLREHEPIPFKMLKELIASTAQYGPTVPFTLALLEPVSTNTSLTPKDWIMITKASLTGGDYLLWKVEFIDQCEQQAERNAAHQIPVTAEMLKGEGNYTGINNQVEYPAIAYQQITSCATRAWRTLPTTGAKTEELSNVRQGPDETYQNFISRLLQAIDWLIDDPGAAQFLAEQLAFEKANSTCKSIIQPYRKKANVLEFIHLCADVGPSYIQGNALAMALQKVFNPKLKQKRERNHKEEVCYSCGQAGHFSRECPSKTPQVESGHSPQICLRCRHGKHWV